MADFTLIVRSRAEGGFWRCGTFFPRAGRPCTEDDFTDDQWRRLMSEPNLVIEKAEDTGPGRDDLVDVVFEVLGSLAAEDFTKAGPPRIDAVRRAVGEHAALIASEHVEAAWERAKAAPG